MPITPDRLTRLREFGLSEYAARAYLALLDLGVAEARDVSTLSKVPQAKIYHVLEQLHDKGLAVILPEFPKKYAPVPFAEFLQRILEEHSRAAGAIERDREVLEETFRVVGDTEVGNRGFFTVVRGRRNVIQKIQEMLHEAKSDLLGMGTSGFALRASHFAPDLTAAKARGVRQRILAPLTPDTIPQLEAVSALAEVRERQVDEGAQTSRVAIIIVDERRAFLINFLPDDENVYAGKDIGVFTDQEAMVRALASLLEAQWRDAPTLAERLDRPDADRALRPEDLDLGRLFDVTRDGVAVATPEGDIVLWNKAAASILGILAPRAVGMRLETVLPDAALVARPDDPTHVASGKAVTGEGETIAVEITAARATDKTGIPYHVYTFRESHRTVVPVGSDAPPKPTRTR